MDVPGGGAEGFRPPGGSLVGAAAPWAALFIGWLVRRHVVRELGKA